MGHKVYVGNLPQDTTTKSLSAFLSQFGEVTECRLMRDIKTDKLRGFGFVSFASESGQKKAIEAKELLFNQRPILIKNAHKSL